MAEKNINELLKGNSLETILWYRILNLMIERTKCDRSDDIRGKHEKDFDIELLIMCYLKENNCLNEENRVKAYNHFYELANNIVDLGE